MPNPKLLLPLLAAVLCLVVPAGAASQYAPQTREGYIAQADPICKKAFDKKLPKPKGKSLRALARPLAAGGRIIGKMADDLGKLEKPAVDAERLGRWIEGLHDFARASKRAAKVLRSGKPGKVRKAQRSLNSAQHKRLGASRGYGFKTCR